MSQHEARSRRPGDPAGEGAGADEAASGRHADDSGATKSGLTHLDPSGAAAMVDVAGKAVTARVAVARGALRCSPAAYELVTSGANPKGDVQQVARIAGIMGGKRAGDLVPLCHVLPAASISVDVEPDPALPGLRVTATARIQGRTGVEMEALTAVSVALLAAYDMLKSADRAMTLEGIELIEKAGGRSGIVSGSG